MRIALLTYSTRPRGGVVHTLYLAEALARTGASVTVFSLDRGSGSGFFRPVDPAVALRLAPFPDRPGESVTDRIVRSIEVLREFIDVTQFDVVHAQDCISANAVGPCVRTVHHLDQFTTPVLVDCHEKAIATPYAHVCVSHAVADEVRSGWGLTPTVIPNGVDFDRFAAASGTDPGSVGARERWSVRLGRYVLAVGGIEPRKGSLDLVEAFATLRRTHPDVSLVFAGGETLFDYRGYRAEFDRRCAELGVEPVVLGTVDDAALPSLVAASSVFAFPSTKEGFGLAAMEALAAGRPVVARDLPILREVFGPTVDYAGSAEALASHLSDCLVLDADRAGRRAEQGRTLARSLTWDSAARAHLDFYAGLPARS